MSSGNKDQGPAGECGGGGACEEVGEGNAERVGAGEGGQEQREWGGRSLRARVKGRGTGVRSRSWAANLRSTQLGIHGAPGINPLFHR